MECIHCQVCSERRATVTNVCSMCEWDIHCSQIRMRPIANTYTDFKVSVVTTYGEWQEDKCHLTKYRSRSSSFKGSRSFTSEDCCASILLVRACSCMTCILSLQKEQHNYLKLWKMTITIKTRVVSIIVWGVMWDPPPSECLFWSVLYIHTAT